MEVTVYVEEEKTSLVSDPDEWRAKVEELGLAGQQELCAQKKANPFMRMDAELIKALTVLCPTHTDIGKFSAEPIPLKALSAYGLANLEEYFSEVEIWYSPGQPDPVMVGTAGREKYLMAQWGPERVSLEALKAKAREVWKRKALAWLQGKINDIDNLVNEEFSGGWTGIHF